MTRLSIHLAMALAMSIPLAACGEDDEPGDSSQDAAPANSADAMSAGVTWTSFASGFFDTYCGECHGAGDASRDYSLLATVDGESSKIRCGVSATSLTGCSIPANQFPIGSGAKPSDEDRAKLVEWIDNGAPE